MSTFWQDVSFWLLIAAAVMGDGLVELVAWVVGI
jgi:hypothetical protein